MGIDIHQRIHANHFVYLVQQTAIYLAEGSNFVCTLAHSCLQTQSAINSLCMSRDALIASCHIHSFRTGMLINHNSEPWKLKVLERAMSHVKLLA